MSILDRVKKRLPEADPDLLEEYAKTMQDRLCIRLGESTLPDTFESICVDSTVKMYRRTYYEGISSEGVANISTSFFEDILAEYDQEISKWKENKANAEGSGRFIHFL